LNYRRHIYNKKTRHPKLSNKTSGLTSLYSESS